MSAPQPLVSYVVVNYRTGELMLRNLALASEALAEYEHELIVVENGGPEDAEILRRAAGDLPGLQILIPGENRGFGAAVNHGARHARGRYLLVANPDSLLEVGTVEPLVAALEADEHAAVAGPKVLNHDGSVQENARRFPSFVTGLFGRTSLLTRLFPRNPFSRRELLASQAHPDATHTVDWVAGSCFLARRQCFLEIGGFDEQYFMYWEDADLCFRLKNVGKKTLFVPEARVVHLGGVSSRKAKVRSVVAFHRSAHRYYRRNNIPRAPRVIHGLVGVGLAARAALVLGREGLAGMLDRLRRKPRGDGEG